MNTTQNQRNQRVNEAMRRAFARPPELPADEWDELVSTAAKEADLFSAILAAQTHVNDGGGYQVQALALTAFKQGDWKAVIQAGRTDGSITDLYAACVKAGLTA